MIGGDERVVLEAIVYGADPGVRVSDRLRALELLLENDVGDGDVEFWDREAANLTESEINAYIDAAQAEVVRELLAGDAETAATYPATAAVLAIYSTPVP